VTLTRIVRTVFTVAVLLLVVGGITIVGAQVVALVAGRGDWMTAISEVVGPPTFVAASVAGILAFVMSYRSGAAQDEDPVEGEPQPERP